MVLEQELALEKKVARVTSAEPGKVQRAVSAGGVVYRLTGDQMEVVLCGRTTPKEIWGLPKGTPDPGESLEETALREVREETGLEVTIQEKIGSIQYWFVGSPDKVRYHKTVYHYLMVPTGGSLENHDPEFDKVRWFPVEEACRALCYKNDVEMVRRAQAMVAEKRPAPSKGC